ncbi:hypothetical protein [Cryptosporangium minutisporangium]|uniref:Uncharacterized protein n=1 Tax=Cryptosporangium minutisporangium TaxID=113569 RepID=A0ABP6SWL2_9ACTN
MSSNFTIHGLHGYDSTDSATRLGWQVAQRVQYIVSQVARQKAGESPDDIARELHTRLRRLGVVPNKREVDAYADQISALPGRNAPPT